MGKKLVIAGFLVSMALALYVFLTRDHRRVSDALKHAPAKEPRIVLEDFVGYRYASGKLTSTVSARFGRFFEPNLAELDGDIHGERTTSAGELQSVNAESATGYFRTTSLLKMAEQRSDLERAELTGFVEVGLKDHLLTTDYAEFVGASQEIRSLRPVRVEGPGRVFFGEEGFTYRLAAQMLEMPGLVKGDMRLEGTDVKE